MTAPIQTKICNQCGKLTAHYNGICGECATTKIKKPGFLELIKRVVEDMRRDASK